ncbi:helix-turn-helix domain-containing protein [Halobacteriovorax vibrionivorans]|uniref:Helix-turn-helix domain-containing protein n=1 Tax=Halobacteriovorax vibrionivorans TaxID=2152716 RepID=A0ABY0IGG4_9BACT|nr:MULTISPECIES: helix-turn-helix domain-containing protein [Halobacteriovorax]RZF21732.1 helix-turn-helix domain-containing protein [Halobacteriovorax vibrionivorans]TGD45647.1 helix-turn-helix domain-containing protein [Halobacteriovorax sp. Y22]
MALVTKNFTKIPNELFQCKKLSPKAIGLYAYLMYRSYTGHTRGFFPCQKKIMKDLSIGSQSTLKKLIDELVVYDFLEFRRGSIFTGNSRYILLIPKICTNNTS